MNPIKGSYAETMAMDFRGVTMAEALPHEQTERLCAGALLRRSTGQTLRLTEKHASVEAWHVCDVHGQYYGAIMTKYLTPHCDYTLIEDTAGEVPREST